MKSVLPYVGSKQRFFNILKDSIPKDHLYVEPFAGGFSLGLRLLNEGLITQAVANDLDENVYNFWKIMKTDYWSLVAEVDTLILLHNKLLPNHNLHEIKQILSEHAKTTLSKTALFYLYKKMNMGTSGQSLKADLSLGSMHYTALFQQASSLLENVTLHNGSYKDLLKYDSPNTFWYLDPPYVLAQNAQYYAKSKEEEFNHEALRDFVNTLEGKVILSYDDCPLVHSLYKNYHIHQIQVPSSLNLKGYSEEVLISNYPITLGVDWSKRKARERRLHEQREESTLTFAELMEETE